MFENIANFFRKLMKSEPKQTHSKDTAKERLHLVLMQDRANVSADFLELMKQEIIEVIKKYIEVDESAIDVRLTNEIGEDGTKGAPSLYANIPIVNIKNDIKASVNKEKDDDVNNKEENEVNNETKKADITETNKNIKEEKEEDKEENKKTNEEKKEENTKTNEEGKEEEKKENKKEQIKENQETNKEEKEKSEKIKTEEASN